MSAAAPTKLHHPRPHQVRRLLQLQQNAVSDGTYTLMGSCVSNKMLPAAAASQSEYNLPYCIDFNCIAAVLIILVFFGVTYVAAYTLH